MEYLTTSAGLKNAVEVSKDVSPLHGTGPCNSGGAALSVTSNGVFLFMVWLLVAQIGFGSQ